MTLKTRKPTGAVPYPLILIEGSEKCGKSWAAITLSRSPRVGSTYVIDLGEGGSDEYGAIPGARFDIVEHDGSFADVLAQVNDVKEEAARAKAAGERPTVLIVDSATDEWDGLKAWANERAAKSASNRRRLQEDPHAEVRVPMNIWNDCTTRHRKLLTALLTFPGIVVLTARGKEVAEIGDNGQPVEGAKTYKVDGHKTLGYDATMWVRMSRTEPPKVVGARSVHAGVRPGRDEPMTVDLADDVDLVDWLIFTALKVDPGAAHVRDVQHLTGGEVTEEERGGDPAERARDAQLLAVSVTGLSEVPAVQAAWRDANTRGLLLVDVSAAVTPDEVQAAGLQPAQVLRLQDWVKACGEFVKSAHRSVQAAVDAHAAETPADEHVAVTS